MPFIFSFPQTIIVNGDVWLHHGTDITSASDIATYGVDKRKALKLAGVDTFWATTDSTSAVIFAGMNPAQGEPAVLNFKIPVELMIELATSEPVQLAEAAGVGFEFFPQCFPKINESLIRSATVTTASSPTVKIAI